MDSLLTIIYIYDIIQIFFHILLFLFLYCNNVMSQSLLVVAQQDTGMYNQTWFYGGSGNSLQEEKIKEYWNEDFYINSVAYTSKDGLYLWQKD